MLGVFLSSPITVDAEVSGSECLHSAGFCNHTHFVAALIGALGGIPQADDMVVLTDPEEDKRRFPAPGHHALQRGLWSSQAAV